VRRIKNHGRWVWQARVAYRGLRKAAFRNSKEEAREAEASARSRVEVEGGRGRVSGNPPSNDEGSLRSSNVGDLQAAARGPIALVGHRDGEGNGNCLPLTSLRFRGEN